MKLRKLMQILLVTSLVAGMTACAESSGGDNKENTDPVPEPGTKCQSSVCQDANVLHFCNPTTNEMVIMTCPYGCNEAEKNCNSAPDTSKCTADVCKNDNVLYKCNVATGARSETNCPNGCDYVANACKDGVEKCTDDVCKDESVLLKCNEDGTTSEEPCPNGCDLNTNVCKDEAEKCESDACKDENVLLKCNEDGTTSEEPCPNGCDRNLNICKDEAEKCEADVCKDDDVLLRCNTKKGTTSEEPCPYGCDKEANACKPEPEKCKADACKDDNVLLKCNTKDGTTSEENCPNGCNTKTNACRTAPKCTENACKDDKKTLLVCDIESGDTSEKKCDAKCLDNDCRSADYCASSEDCTEEGKTFCNTTSHVCTDFACMSVNCKTAETCVLGACVPDADLNAKYNDECDPDKFVEHCRGKNSWFCRLASNEGGVKVYKVGNSECVGAKKCVAYKDGTNVKSTCTENMTREEACGTSANEGTFCEESADQGWLTTYTCAKSTNNEDIVFVSGFEMCDQDYGCLNDRMCE